MSGLPEAPEGHFFRVKKWHSGLSSQYTLIVQLRRKTWYGSRKIGDSICEHTVISVRRAAESALAEALRKINRPKTLHLRDHFVGDYPPKTL